MTQHRHLSDLAAKTAVSTAVADLIPSTYLLNSRADICGVVLQPVRCCCCTAKQWFSCDLYTRSHVLNSEGAPKLGTSAHGKRGYGFYGKFRC